jgi:metal-responsive CopG/Arc/MetJ family transcriptional regulator
MRVAMRKAAKIAISLPEDVLAAVEKERQGSGETRSEFFRRAAERLLRLRREQEQIAQYIRAYQEKPETEDEIAATRRSASSVLAEEPWE